MEPARVLLDTDVIINWLIQETETTSNKELWKAPHRIIKLIEEKDTQAQLVRHENTESLNDLKEKLAENTKMMDYIVKNKLKYEKLLKEQEETLILAKNDREVTKMKKDKVEKLLQEVEEGKKSSELAWDKKNNDLELERLEIKGKLNYFKEKDKRLKIREKVLGDKERALERKIKQVV